MALVLTIEAHLLNTQPAWCPSCEDFSASEHTVALVEHDSLAVIGRCGSIVCACGHEDTHRLT